MILYIWWWSEDKMGSKFIVYGTLCICLCDVLLGYMGLSNVF
ncbi:hypothetical protein NC651_017485 [Populus alba x Populus x berolinensis]|nr:hypothetical protein NC651_015923 [Populus alba x Populus x berolinensis]KAJ6915066.1 hypothetical protein NC651_017137 [Populus alba x Populus x berolinensis]KAJ6915078.1 hypothetical protein NC651_017147 [Populus alba x Populus x berolinensis]KAJ6915500.1 hypothetical protein NC651_017485 [Populus alba x Populus x berolinensis]